MTLSGGAGAGAYTIISLQAAIYPVHIDQLRVFMKFSHWWYTCFGLSKVRTIGRRS